VGLIVVVVCKESNPANAGLVVYDGELREGQHYADRFYSLEVFHRIRARIERNARIPPKLVGLPQYLLAGLLRCGHCGNQMTCTCQQSANRRYYRCSTGRERGSDVGCINNQRPADLIEAVIISQLRERAQAAGVQDLAAELLPGMVEDDDRRLREDVERLEEEVEKRLDEYRFWSHERYEGRISPEEFDLRREHLMAEKAKLEEQLEESRARLKSSVQRAAELEQALEILSDFDTVFDGLDLDQQREMIQLLIADAKMFHQEDGTTRLAFTLRGLGDFERVLPRLTGGDTKMTPRQIEAYMLWAQGLDRKAIAREMGVSAQVVSQYLSIGKSRVGADSREEIEENEAILFTGRRRRKRTPDPDRPPLTDAQKEVLSLYADGLTRPQIGEELDISPSTAYVHLMNCRARLGRTTNDEAAGHARQMGYI